MRSRFRLAAAAAAACSILACNEDEPSSPGVATTFTVALTTAAEVPVCENAGDDAAGAGTVTINAQNTSITISNLTWTGLSGAATLGHIHSGAAGVAGPPVINFGANPTSPFNDVFTADDYPDPVPAGAPANFAAFISAMKAGNTYINIHTEDCGPGEIRGQLVADQ
jgi:hypothetical protein